MKLNLDSECCLNATSALHIFVNNKLSNSKSDAQDRDKIYKLTMILTGLFKRLKNMAQKKQAGHLSNCQITAENAVISTYDSIIKVPKQKRKEDAKKTLYINRI